MSDKLFIALLCGMPAAALFACGLDERVLTDDSSVDVPRRVATASAEAQIPSGTLDEAETADAGLQHADAASTAASSPETRPPLAPDAGVATEPLGHDAGEITAKPPGRCPDVDANGVLDCVETLLVNPSFDEDTEGWAPDADVRSSWQANDGWQSTASGSVLVLYEAFADSDVSTFGGLYQCVATQSGHAYAMGARVWIPGDQDAAEAGIQVLFMTEPNCTGYPVGSAAALSASVETWVSVTAEFIVPPEVIALKVRLGSVKPLRTESFAALIDDVLLRDR